MLVKTVQVVEDGEEGLAEIEVISKIKEEIGNRGNIVELAAQKLTKAVLLPGGVPAEVGKAFNTSGDCGLGFAKEESDLRIDGFCDFNVASWNMPGEMQVDDDVQSGSERADVRTGRAEDGTNETFRSGTHGKQNHLSM